MNNAHLCDKHAGMKYFVLFLFSVLIAGCGSSVVEERYVTAIQNSDSKTAVIEYCSDLEATYSTYPKFEIPPQSTGEIYWHSQHNSGGLRWTPGVSETTVNNQVPIYLSSASIKQYRLCKKTDHYSLMLLPANCDADSTEVMDHCR